MDISAIKARKKELKMTLDEISAKSGIPKRTVEDIFREATKNPRIDTVQAIEAALNLSPNPIDTNEETKNKTLSQKEEELLFLFRSLNSAMQDYILQVIKAIPKNT